MTLKAQDTSHWQSMALYKALLHDRIEGLPEHICDMKIELDISRNTQPRLTLNRVMVDAAGVWMLASSGSEPAIETQTYRLIVIGSRIIAERMFESGADGQS